VSHHRRLRKNLRRRLPAAGQRLSYNAGDLLGADQESVAQYLGGTYVTLRLTSSMYHRFHARTTAVSSRYLHIGGHVECDPIALKRVEQLFCKKSAPSSAAGCFHQATRSLWCR